MMLFLNTNAIDFIDFLYFWGYQTVVIYDMNIVIVYLLNISQSITHLIIQVIFKGSIMILLFWC